MRVPQAEATKGSQKWIQLLVNECRPVFASALAPHLPTELAQRITWLSPLREDEYAEYRDADFLARLGINCPNVPLRRFWPARGPQWDALGRASASGPFFLVEAKANVPELVSSCSARAPRSLRLIREGLRATRDMHGCRASIDWMSGFYQHANRLAHLHFLRALNAINAYMIFLYFLNDDTHLPTSRDEWGGALALQKKLMGLNGPKSRESVIELFIDVKQLGQEPHP